MLTYADVCGALARGLSKRHAGGGAVAERDKLAQMLAHQKQKEAEEAVASGGGGGVEEDEVKALRRRVMYWKEKDKRRDAEREAELEEQRERERQAHRQRLELEERVLNAARVALRRRQSVTASARSMRQTSHSSRRL
jgi:hypothetical protein